MRGCQVVDGTVTACAGLFVHSCKKSIHNACYLRILEKNGLTILYAVDGVTELIICTKTCHSKLEKYVKKQRESTENANARTSWSGDGANGTNDPRDSIGILIEWLRTFNRRGISNFDMFQGKHNDGKTKKQIAEMVARLINNAGVKKPRTGKDVLNKINHLYESFKRADAWAHTETGAGLRETDHGTFKEALIKKFPYYFELYDVFSDRASARPCLTNEDLGDSEDELNTNSDPPNTDVPVSIITSDLDDSSGDIDDGREDDQENGVSIQNHTPSVNLMTTSSRISFNAVGTDVSPLDSNSSPLDSNSSAVNSITGNIRAVAAINGNIPAVAAISGNIPAVASVAVASVAAIDGKYPFDCFGGQWKWNVVETIICC